MRGGRRLGAGRRSGSLNKRTRAIAEGAAAQGITPLDYLLKILRDETADHSDRYRAAVSAAPYIHPRLVATTVSGGDEPVETHLTFSWLDPERK